MTVFTEGWDYGDTSFRVPTAADGERTWSHVQVPGTSLDFNGFRIRGGKLRVGLDAPSAGDTKDENGSVAQWDYRQEWATVCDQGVDSNDMYVRAVITWENNPSRIYLVARASIVGGVLHGYGLQVRPGSTPQVRLFRIEGGTLTTFGSTYDGAVSGDTFEVRTVGTTITGYVNGVEQVTGTDSGVTSGGQVALQSNVGANQAFTVASLKAGPVVSGSTVETPIEPAVPVVTHAWLGGVNDTAAQVKVGVRNVTDARLVVSAGGSSVVTSGYVVPGAGSTCTFDVTGLTAATTYTYEVEYRANGGDGAWSQTGRIRTAPSPGTAASLTFGFASCQGSQTLSGDTHTLAAAQVRNPWTYDRMADRDVDLFIHAGDIHYRNLTTTNAGPWRRAWRDILQADRTAAFFRDNPISYTPDDHDYSYDFDTHAARTIFRQTHDEFASQWSRLAADGTLGHQIVWGRVRIINLDTRTERVTGTTILGTPQKDALKVALLAATEPLIFVNVGVPWNGDSDDAWGGINGASAERAELGKFVHDNDLTDRVVLMHGDQHALAYDNGTNTAYGTGVTVGPKLIAAAPIESTPSNKGGPYTIGPIPDLSTDPHDGAEKMQYAAVEVADTGGALDVTVRGMGASQDGVTETELYAVSFTVGGFDPGAYYSTDGGTTWVLAGAS